MHTLGKHLFPLPLRRSNTGARGWRNPQNGSAIGIQVVVDDGVSPPVGEAGVAETQAKADNDSADGSTDIQSTGQDVVVLSYKGKYG